MGSLIDLHEDNNHEEHDSPLSGFPAETSAEPCDDACDVSLNSLIENAEPCAPCLNNSSSPVINSPTPSSRRIDTTPPLFGGGDFSIDRTHYMPPATDDQDGYLTKEDHQLLGLIGGGNTDSRIISGNITWSGSGLTFDWSDFLYIILGTPDASLATQHTLDPADPTLPRIDTLWVGVGGTTGVITGIPDANPVKPQVDPATQLEASIVLVPAGATTPGEISNVVIYDENIESTFSTDIVGANPAYVLNPFQGALSLRIPNIQTARYFKFVRPTTLNINDFEFIKFYVRLSAQLGPTTFFSIALQSGVTFTTSFLTISNGSFGFSRNITSAWQTIVVPVSSLSFISDSLFDTVYFRFSGNNANALQFDFIHLQAGNIVTGPNGVQSFNTRTGHVMPAVGDYVVPAVNLAAFPVTGVLGKIYVAEDTNSTYRWTGSAYVQIGGSTVDLTPYQLKSEKNQVNGYPGLDSLGKINPLQLPGLAITDTYVVASQAAMLLLDVETGDVAVRSDINKTFILAGTDPTNLADWQELLTPTTGVTSFNGRTGAVMPLAGDYTEILGGTGQTSYATGDMLYASAANTLSKLAIGSDGQMLQIVAGLPVWGAAPSSMVYPSAGIPVSTGSAWGTSIAAGTNGQVLTMVSGAPAWAASSGWGLTGNAGTNSATNYIGTTDNIDFVIKRNATAQMTFQSSKIMLGNGNLHIAQHASGFAAPSIVIGWNNSPLTGASGFVCGAANSYTLPPVILGTSNTIAATSGEVYILGNGNTVSSQTGHIIIGKGNTSNGLTNGQRWNIIIGNSNNTNGFGGGGMFGTGLKYYDNGQLLFGCTDANIPSYYIREVYFGMGVRNEATNLAGGQGNSLLISPSGAYNGTDYEAGSITIAGGKGTGAATGGDVILSTASILASGATLQSLTSRWFVKFNTGILSNVSIPDNSAQLQINSTDRGFLLPRMTTVQREAIASPATGLQVYDTTLNVIYFYDGTAWKQLYASEAEVGNDLFNYLNFR